MSTKPRSSSCAQQGLQEMLEQAILAGDLLQVEAAVNQGADVNIKLDGSLPVCLAISNGEEDIAIYLLSHGTDLTLPPPPSPKPDPNDSSISATSELMLAKWRSPLTLVMVNLTTSCVCLMLKSSTLLPEPLTRHLIYILMPLSPLASHVNDVIARAMPWIPCEEQTTNGSRRRLVYLLGIYGLSQFLTGKPQYAMQSLLSWNWKGTIGRVFVFRALETSRLYSEVVNAILGSAFKSERLVMSLLDQIEFSPDYVRRCVTSEESLLAKLWLTAAEEGYDEVIRRLIALGVPVDFDVSFLSWKSYQTDVHLGLTALTEAVSKGHLELVRTLLEYGADVNVQTTPEAATPLIRALRPGRTSSSHSDELQGDARLQLVGLLLDHNANLNVVDNNGRNSLSYAAENANADVFRLLLGRGADPTIADNQGRTLVHFAVGRGDAAKILDSLDKIDIDLDRADDDGYTPFLHAVQSDQVDLAEYFLQHGADPLAKTASGLTALQLAASYGPPRMLELLVKTGIDVNHGSKSKASALVKACSRHVGRALPLSILLVAGADPNALSWEGWPKGSPLHRVCREISYCWSDTREYTDQLDSIKLLIKHGADVNGTYTDPRMARERDVSSLGLVSSHAPDSIKVKALEALLEAGARPDGRNDRGLPALLGLCAESGYIEGDGIEKQCVELLVQHGADLTVRDQDGMTCLHHAAESCNFIALAACIEHLPSQSSFPTAVEWKDSLGRTALHLACSNTSWMTQSQYLAWSEHQRSGNRDYGNWHVSLESGLVFRILYAAEADPHSQDSHDATSLHIAAKAGNPRIMAMLLLWTGPSLLFDSPDRCKRLAFHYAVRSVEVTKMLLCYYARNSVEHQAYFDVLNLPESINRPLMKLKNDMVESAWEGLQERKYRSRHPDAAWNEQEYPRPWWRGAFNQPDEFGNTPLHYAALAGSAAVVKLYLNMPELDLSNTNVDGDTVLDYALEHRDCLIAILEKAPELSASNQNRQAPQGVGVSANKSGRQASIEFIDQLDKSYVWGVYGDRGRS
ncbi:ankyrin repeat-containing domain protein [Ilyonectria sp. MPI-CAGE-AT-0026]|nr:ankyrin repeat-containing domain protein [Ilyonectria sp. MPI-CAGE-AT-0026]